jgi:hypothetical protein
MASAERGIVVTGANLVAGAERSAGFIQFRSVPLKQHSRSMRPGAVRTVRTCFGPLRANLSLPGPRLSQRRRPRLD